MELQPISREGYDKKKEELRQLEQDEMPTGDRLDIWSIAAADHRRERQVEPLAGFGDLPIPGAQAVITERKKTEPIVGMRIDAGVIEDQLRSRLLDRLRERWTERCKIGFIARALRQADIKIGGRLVERPVGIAVDRQGEDARIVCEDPRRAVAMVYIAVDHQNA